MTIRSCLTVFALAATLGACASMQTPALKPAPAAPVAQLNTPPNTDQSIGKPIEDVIAINGPASQQWDMPDGRRAYQWEQNSVTARVGAAGRGELVGATTETTCYYTLYAHQDAKGRWTVVSADAPRPDCLKVAMNGAAPAAPAAK